MNVLAYRRHALEVIYILAEGIAWFIAIAVLATMVERSFTEALADRIEGALSTGFRDPAAAEVVLADLRAVAGSDAGPMLPVVLGAAFGGFLLMRFVPRLDLGVGLSAAVLVAASLLGVNLLLHLAMGDLRIWDASRLVLLLDDPSSQVADGVDLQAFVADPDIHGPHASALALTFMGLTAVWFRFMLAARAPVRLERMARSFTISFIAVFIALFVARAADVEAAGRYAVPQFVLGMLGMAIGNHERAVPAGEAEDRATPWLTSVGGTIGLLLAASGVIALLAALQFGAVLSAAGDVLLVVIEFVAVLVITPIFWIVSGILGFLLGGASFGDNLPDLARDAIRPEDLGLTEDSEGRISVPSWVVDSLKFFAFVAVVYAMYWVGRRILASRTPDVAPVAEVRERRTGGAGVGQLLADLVSFGRKRDPDRWMAGNEAYQLFGRALSVSRERGLTMLPSETPLEFGDAALVHLASPPIADAARLFERVRYGRHEATEEEIRNASRTLSQWDESNPATEEIRARIHGHRPLDEVDTIRVRMALSKRGLNPTDEGVLRGE